MFSQKECILLFGDSLLETKPLVFWSNGRLFPKRNIWGSSFGDSLLETKPLVFFGPMVDRVQFLWLSGITSKSLISIMTFGSYSAYEAMQLRFFSAELQRHASQEDLCAITDLSLAVLTVCGKHYQTEPWEKMLLVVNDVSPQKTVDKPSPRPSASLGKLLGLPVQKQKQLLDHTDRLQRLLLRLLSHTDLDRSPLLYWLQDIVLLVETLQMLLRRP